MIQRKLTQTINNRLFKGKAIIIVGARQVGKTSLMRNLMSHHKEPILSLNCDDPEVRAMLSGVNLSNLRLLIGKHKIVIIDEAQRVDGIGLTLKLITDNIPDVQLLVTGSSSLELRNRLDEPLTGRKFEYTMFPVSTAELLDTYGLLGVKQTLENRLIFGSYPDIITHSDDAAELLTNLSGSYLYRDLLSLDDIRRPVLL